MITNAANFHHGRRRPPCFGSTEALRMQRLLIVVVTLAGCAPSGEAGRRAVEHDRQAYRCAGFNPVADETNYPSDVELAGGTLQHSPTCSGRTNGQASGKKP